MLDRQRHPDADKLSVCKVDLGGRTVQIVCGAPNARAGLKAPDKRARDGDNLLKCLFDTLKTNGLIEDDSNRVVRRHELVWADDGPACVVLIMPFSESLAA